MPKLPSPPDDAVVAAFNAHSPTLFARIDDMMREPGAGDIAEREYIAADVSALNACSSCLGAHVIHAEAFGLFEAQLTAAPAKPRLHRYVVRQ